MLWSSRVHRGVSHALFVDQPPSRLKAGGRFTGCLLLLLAMTAVPAIGDTDQAVSQVGPGQLSKQAFSVTARIDKLFFYPCSDCHAFMDTNASVRELDVEDGHPAQLTHGRGLFWCFACHDESDYDRLQDLGAAPIDIDKGYQVCGGCHSSKYRDWAGGAHGKRVADWRGGRLIYSCVECHNPHQPSIQPRAPRPPPPVRAGLTPMTPEHGIQTPDPRPLE